MPLFDRFKESASRVAAEADRALRVNRLEGAIKQRRDQRQEHALRLGDLAAQLHQSGRLNVPELQPLAQIVLDLDKQMADLERESHAIRAEASDQRQIQPYGHLCSRERTLLPPLAAFCPSCGAAAIDVEPPALAPSRTCSQCGHTVNVPGNFCPECGARLPSVEKPGDASSPEAGESDEDQTESAVTPTSGDLLAATRCSQCGTEMPAQATFCPDCGRRR